MKTVVTGGAGFIGSHLVDALLAKGADVIVIDDVSSGLLSNLNTAATLYQLDICDPEVKQLIKDIKPDVLFHLAAQADVGRSVKNPAEDARINIDGTIHLLESCVEGGVKNFVFSSTSAVYGNIEREIITEKEATSPSSFYGFSKLAAECYIKLFHKLFGLPYTILRYANVYGPRQLPKGDGGVVAVFLERLKAAETILIQGSGEQTRDFIYVQDVVKANLLAAKAPTNEVMHISTGNSISINSLLEHLIMVHGAPAETHFTEPRPGDIMHSCLSNELAKYLLDWQPEVPLAKGLEHAYRSSN